MLYFICERRSFFHGASSGCASLHGLFFCKNSGKAAGNTRPPAAAKKSDKNLRPPKNLVYYIQELRKRNLLRYIRRIRRRVRSFLCSKPPLPLPAAWGFVFCCRRNPAYCMYKYKKRKEKKSYETKKRKRKNNSCV